MLQDLYCSPTFSPRLIFIFRISDLVKRKVSNEAILHEMGVILINLMACFNVNGGIVRRNVWVFEFSKFFRVLIAYPALFLTAEKNLVA